MAIPFAGSERASLGIEWELELVDPDTRELASVACEVLAALRPPGAERHPKAKHELLQCTVEVITGVCGTVADAMADLRSTVAEVRDAAADSGAGLMCSGTHPFSDWAAQRVTPDPRYAGLLERLQWLGRRLQIFGVHVHVGVRDGAKAIAIVNGLTPYLPLFLALSASSPYWQGTDTGLASARSKVFEALPNAGLPARLSVWEDYESYVDGLVGAGAIGGLREVWWDVRPHPDFGTVELRICDGLPTGDEVAAVAALAQCLVDRLDRDVDRGYTRPIPTEWALRENRWRAARYGLAADIIADDRGTVVPVEQAISDVIEELMPTAQRLECAEELAGVARILAVGGSAERQRSVAAAHGGDLTRVVDALLAEMRDGLPR